MTIFRILYNLLSHSANQFIFSFVFQELTVDPASTSSHVRAKTSAKDDRGSAQSAGYMAVTLISILGILIVLPDAVVAITWMYASYKYFRSN